LAGLAVYIQQTFNLADPPGPGVVAVAEDNDLEEHGVDPPLGFISPLNLASTLQRNSSTPIPDPSENIQVGGPKLE
jgi:hypothetical protein